MSAIKREKIKKLMVFMNLQPHLAIQLSHVDAVSIVCSLKAL